MTAWLMSSGASAASFSGQLKSTTDVYSNDLGPETDDIIPYLQLDLSGKHKFTRTWRTQWHLLGMSNLATSDAPEKAYFDVPEAFVEKKMRKFKFRAGMDTINWGVVDVSSPSDTVNTTAMFHPLRPIKQGAPMLEASWDRESVAFDAVYIPIQRRPLLPSEDSRWLPRKVLLNVVAEGQEVVLPETLTYHFDTPEDLKNSLINNYGGKLSGHQGRVDWQLTYFEGAAPSQKVRHHLEFLPGSTATDLVIRSPAHFAPVTYRIRTTGGAFVYAREKWIFRAESAYQATMNDDELLQPWSWSNVGAVETNIDLGSSVITVLGQFYYSQNPQAADNVISSTFRLFDRTAILGARWQYSEQMLFTFASLFETRSSGLYWSAGFERKLSDSLRWGMSWRDFSAPRDGLMKTFERNDHGTLDLTYFF